MKCPYCESTKHEVMDSRRVPKAIRRRRMCKLCSRKWTTYERSTMDVSEFGRGVHRRVRLIRKILRQIDCVRPEKGEFGKVESGGTR